MPAPVSGGGGAEFGQARLENTCFPLNGQARVLHQPNFFAFIIASGLRPTGVLELQWTQTWQSLVRGDAEDRAGPRESDNSLSLARLWERTSTDDQVDTQAL